MLLPGILLALVQVSGSAALRAQDPAPASSPSLPKEGSLEAFLRKVRAEREAELARLRGPVEALFGRLTVARSSQESNKIQAEIDALGPEAAPLLLAYLDPGERASPERERACGEIALALARLRSPAVQGEVLRLARTASPKGRVLAVRVLAAASDPERAKAALREVFDGAHGPLRGECVRSLARLDPAEPLVERALSDPDPEVVRAALEALTPFPREEPRAAVVELAQDPARAAPVLAPLVLYLRAPGQAVDEETAAALLRLACRSDLALEPRLAVLDAFPRLGLPLSMKLRKEIEPLLESSDSALREGALVALALLKDARAKRDLLRFYDDLVRGNERWPQAYQRRGDILLRIGEYADAARDYRSAIELQGKSAKLPGNRDLWVNLARACVKDDKLRSAAEALEEFGLTSELKRELTGDPDFAPLREHPRYRKVLE